MELKVKPRRMGKTTKAIEQAAMSGAYIVVATRQDAQRVAKQAKEMECNIRFPVTFDELLSGKMKGSFVRNIVIDDGDRLIQRVCSGLMVEMVTWNGRSSENPYEHPHTKALRDIAEHNTLCGEKYNNHSSAYSGVVEFAQKALTDNHAGGKE